MNMHSLLILFISTTLTGCTIFPSIVDVNVHPMPERRQVTEAGIANLPVGAEVEIAQTISETSSAVSRGTVMKAGPSGVALCNCTREGRTISVQPRLFRHIPIVSRLFKNSGVGRNNIPVEWVSAHQIDTVRIISHPPHGYVAPELGISLDIHKTSGHNETSTKFKTEPDPTADLVIPFRKPSEADIANLPVGSQLKIIRLTPNGSATLTYGRVMKTGTNGIALCNCVREIPTQDETLPALRHMPFASRLFKNSSIGLEHIPVEWVSLRDIDAVSVISPPPEGFVAPELFLNLGEDQSFKSLERTSEVHGTPIAGTVNMSQTVRGF